VRKGSTICYKFELLIIICAVDLSLVCGYSVIPLKREKLSWVSRAGSDPVIRWSPVTGERGGLG
jgi:hypothetical protein